MSGPILVQPDEDKRRPRHPEGQDQNEGHDVTGVGEVLRECGRVLLIVDRNSASYSPHHRKYVGVSVHDSDKARTQSEDGQGGGVGGHVLPVQHADEGISVEQRLVEA
uniref:Uncharacterized protein n=1 Tax=Clastoptera arizonana TaxID=38151 RepID=A0A1B6D1W0_9HEMI